jgi:hypothetical protein
MLRFVSSCLVIAMAAVIESWTPTMAADDHANVVQADLFTDFTCNGGPVPIPDVTVTVMTTGGPLLVLLTMNILDPQTIVEADALITPIIDGTTRTTDTLRFQVSNNGVNRPGWGVFAFSRVYFVPAGTHTVSWEMQCMSNQIVARGWLTVYELPLVKPKS